MKRLSKLLALKNKHRKSKQHASERGAEGSLLDKTRNSDSSAPVLPIEIWQYIVELASCLPVAPSVSSPDLFHTGSNYIILPKEDEYSSWRDARTVQLVCRAWRTVAVKHAYERLVLCCERHMKPLARTLEESKQKDPDGLGHGRWVREIETRRTDCPGEADDNQEKLRAELKTFATLTVRIIRCVPNLEIYINKNGWAKPLGLNTYRAVMMEIGTHCGSSLLRLQWTASESPRWDDLKNLLSKTSNLRTLSLLYVNFARTNGDGGLLAGNHPPERCTLRNLTQLHLGPFPPPYGAEIPYWDPLLEFLMLSRNNADPATASPLPMLNTLSITPLNMLSTQTPSERFFVTYGAQLEHLATLDLTPEELVMQSHSESALPVFNRSLPTLLEACPKLRSLILNPLQPIPLFPRRLSHRKLERIALFPPSEGIVELPDRFSRFLQQPIGDMFAELTSGAFPRLCNLRLRDRGELGVLGMDDSREWIEEWQRKFEQRGIRFENGDGLRFMLTIEDSMEYMPDGI